MTPPSDPYGEIPNFSGVTAQFQEQTRAGDPARFFPTLSSAEANSITGRILNIPCANVFRNAGAVPASGVAYVVPWDVVDYDSSGMWNALNPERLTAHVAGVYEIEGWGQWAASAAVTRRMLLTRVSAAGVSTLYCNPGNEVTAVAAGLNTDQHISYPIALQSGEYVTLTVTQFSGGVLAFNGATTTSRVNGFSATLKSTFGSEN